MQITQEIIGVQQSNGELIATLLRLSLTMGAVHSALQEGDGIAVAKLLTDFIADTATTHGSSKEFQAKIRAMATDLGIDYRLDVQCAVPMGNA